LAGRAPAQGAALVMHGESVDFLACQTQSKYFDYQGTQVSFGIISYYAATSLAQAADLGSWLQGIEARSEADYAAGKLPLLSKPRLQIVGDPPRRLPGVTVAA
jgi:hypothetical protein